MPRWTEDRKAAIDAVMKETIYNATVKVLKEHGYEGMTMDRVAAVAKLAKGTLYNYYENKDQLLVSTHHRLIEPILEIARSIANSRLPPGEKLRELVIESLEFCVKNRLTLTLLAQSGIGKQKDPQMRENFVDHLQQILNEGIKKGAFRPMKPRRTAEMIFGAMAIFFEFRLQREEPIDLEEDLATFMEFYSNGISV
jgi:AcrR family transcriptional regulator